MSVFQFIKRIQNMMKDNRGIVIVNQQQMKGNQCLHQMLGKYIDIEWDIKTGTMKASSTKKQSFSHWINQEKETFNYVPLRHGTDCLLLDEKSIKNDQRTMRPCSVVLLEVKQDNTFLATQRSTNMPFGGKWVLPGGHLQRGENIIEGGIRQCMEEVGFQKSSIKDIKLDVMAWESVYSINQEIKATSLVLFFRIETQKFEVVGQQGEIEKWQWRKMDKNEDPWGGGWAQGDINYLRFLKEQKK